MKRPLLALTLLATLLAAYFVPPSEQAIALPSKSAAPRSIDVRPEARRETLPPVPALSIRPRSYDGDAANIFAPGTWSPPPPARKVPEKTVVAASPAEAAPALPIRFLGRWIEDQKTKYFLQVADRNVAVAVGEATDDTYTLDSMDNGTLTFTYLPLKQKQTLVVGEVN